ncbi:MAG: hypothetical protein PVJ92_02550 [Candidatus Dependentiae bacterium]
MKYRLKSLVLVGLLCGGFAHASSGDMSPGKGGAGKEFHVLVTRTGASSLDPQQSILRFMQRALPGVWFRTRNLLQERMFQMQVQSALQQVVSTVITSHIQARAAEGVALTPDQVTIEPETIEEWRTQIIAEHGEALRAEVEGKLKGLDELFDAIVKPYLEEDITWSTFDERFQLRERVGAFVTGVDGMIGALPFLVRAFTTEALAAQAATWLQTNWSLLKGVLSVMSAVAVAPEHIAPIAGDSAGEVAEMFGLLDQGMDIYTRMAHIAIAVTAGNAGNVKKGFYCALMYALRSDCLPAALAVPVLFISDIPAPTDGDVVAPSIYNSFAVDGNHPELAVYFRTHGEARVGYLMPFVDNPEGLDPYLQMLLNLIWQGIQSDIAKKNAEAAAFAQMLGIPTAGTDGDGDGGSGSVTGSAESGVKP